MSAGQVWRHSFDHSDRARTEGAGDGAILVITGPGKRIVGAHILAPAAGEMIGEMVLAMDRGLTLSPGLASMIHVYPTLSTGFGQLAAEATYENIQKPVVRFSRRLSRLG